MFSLISKFVNHLWKTSDDSSFDKEDKLLPEEIDEIVAFLSSEDGEKKEIYQGSGSHILNGKVTFTSEDYCLIDEKYYLDFRKFRSREILEVGTRITFSVFRLSEEDEWQISKVLSCGEETWEEEDTEERVILGEDEGRIMDLSEAKKAGLAQYRTLVAKVLQREGRCVTLEPGGIQFSLDQVKSNVVPYTGDWLSLEALVELDEEAGDLGGKILKVERVSALRTRLVENGKVTHLEGPCAVINENVLAHRLAFSPGYEPSIGDAVVLQAIESECGAGCSWRALALAPALPFLQKRVSTVEERDTEEDTLLYSDKEGITVTGNPDFGNLTIGSESTILLYVGNNSSKTQLLIRSRFHIPRAQSQMTVSQLDNFGVRIPMSNKAIPINPGKSLPFEFRCKARFLGSSSELFVFTFRGFRIGRKLQVRVIDSQTSNKSYIEEIPGRDLYKDARNNPRWNRSRRSHQSEAVIVPGIRPHKPPAFVSMRLPMYDVTGQLWDIVVGPDDESQSNKKAFSCMIREVVGAVPSLNPLDLNGISLCQKNYKRKFHALLHLEEIEMSLRMMERDLFRVSLQLTGPGGQYLSLEVPGLAEKRPSILVGDRVLLASSNSTGSAVNDDEYGKGTKYEGFVHKILRSEVWLKFNIHFHEMYKTLLCKTLLDYEAPRLEWDVSFHFNRTPLRRCHLAVDLALSHLGEEFLFPMQIKKKKPQVYVQECSDTAIQNLCFGSEDLAEKIPRFKGEENVDAGVSNSNGKVSVGQGILMDVLLESGEVESRRSKPVSSLLDQQSSNPEKSHIAPARNLGEEGESALVTNGVMDEKSPSLGSKIPHPKVISSNVPHRIPVSERLFGVNSPKSSLELGKTHDALPAMDVINFENLRLPINETNSGVTGSQASETSIPNHQKRRLKWFNEKLNVQQKNAVLNILKGEARPLPYVIFGPPGTGKTVTLVEAILQTLQLVPESRIMVTSPSNSSANLVAERILESVPLNPGELVRLIALHCLEKGNIPSRLMPYCTTGIIGRTGSDGCEVANFDDGERKLRMPMSSAALGRHRVTIGTCVALGQMYAVGLPQGHFTHIFFDEAGQATEPEALIPLGFLSTSAEIGWGQAVFAGDPRQLGPVVLSRLALHLGLGQSVLDRLLSSSPYAPDPISFPSTSGHYNPSVVTRLVMNYRSVPDLLSYTSHAFYDGSLVPTISPYSGKEGVLLLRLGDHLPLMKCHSSLGEVKIASPLVFHGVRGEECRNEDSPSWFNPMEAVQCLDYVKMLYHLGGLDPEDIGIITPYVEQVRTIRNLIADHCLPLPSVGTVEEFQGQERLAIIMSAVRTSKAHIMVDLIHALGFVSSPNRLNVSTSRARALLIVIGDPHLLNHDPVWNKLIQRCVDNDSYIGCNLPKLFLDPSGDFECKDDVEESNALAEEEF